MHYASSGAQPSEQSKWSDLAPNLGAPSHSSALTDLLISAAPCEQDGVAIGIDCQEHRVHVNVLCVVQSSLQGRIRAFHLLQQYQGSIDAKYEGTIKLFLDSQRAPCKERQVVKTAH